MTRATLQAALAAALVVLAGCAGSVPGGTAGPGETTDDGPSAAAGGAGGTVSFYLSDRPNAIDDFAHLNVTVTSVGFHRVGDAGGDDAATTTGANSSTTTNGTTTANATTTAVANATTTEADEEDGPDDGDESDDGDGSGGGSWVTYDVPNVTVDLTRLVGANATKLAEFGVPAGEYDAVFVYVTDIEATLDSGEQVRVKLPSRKLQVHSRFRVGANASVDFVYDIAVHEAGKSGKYILRPVVSESGTDVPVEEVGEENRADDEVDDRGKGDEKRNERGRDDDRDQDEQSSLNVTLVGNVTPGGNATLTVTRNGSAVANATVEVDGERVGRTDADGTLTVAVPDAEELAVSVEKGDAEAELEVEFDADDRGNGS